MSATVSAVPFLLIFAIGSGIIQGIQTGANVLNGSLNETMDNSLLHLDNKTMEEIFNKEFKTNIMDNETLVKTLEEYGAVNIVDNISNISCDCENFHLDFYKNENEPYTLLITYNKDTGLNELVENLGSDYASNAQEISYNKIKERLQQQNLTIDEEEIYDDNTIVLTVNLE